MSTIIPEQKAAARRRIRAAQAALPERERLASDEALLARFIALPEVSGAGTVLLFFGVGAEVKTAPLFASLRDAGKILALPRCLPGRRMEAGIVAPGQRLHRGAYGIPEPGADCPALPRDKIDLILVPALCYDKSRFRLGQGGGYYDRYLEHYKGCTAGLCRDVFLQERLPRAVTDLPVGILLTETQCFR